MAVQCALSISVGLTREWPPSSPDVVVLVLDVDITRRYFPSADADSLGKIHAYLGDD